MAKHTPGSWNYGEDNRGRKRVFAEGWEIVRALSSHGFRRIGKDEREANAHLIAAAPDMLAALEAILANSDCLPERLFQVAARAAEKAKGDGS